MNKTDFLFLLSLRELLRSEAETLIDVGFDIHSERVGSLFRMAENVEEHISESFGLQDFSIGLNTLNWALEHLDRGETAKYTVDGESREIKNYDELWTAIQEEAGNAY